MASYNRIDPIMLERLLPSGNLSAGIYASAYRLLEALVMLAYLVSVPLLPVSGIWLIWPPPKDLAR